MDASGPAGAFRPGPTLAPAVGATFTARSASLTSVPIVLAKGVVGSVLVLLGGLVVSTLPASTTPLELGVLGAVRGSTVGRMAGLGVVVLGLGMLAASWLWLCTTVAHVDRFDHAGQRDALVLVRSATFLWSVPLLLAPPLFSRDGWSYAAQGTLTHYDISPYEHGPGVLLGPIVQAVDPRWLHTPAPYGPVPLILGDVAAGFTGDPWLLVVAHRLVALAGLGLLAWSVPRLAQWCRSRAALASALVLCSPLMLANGVGGLHNDLLMAGLMAAALVVTVEHGWVYGALLGGLAAAVKLPGGLVCLGVALIALPAGATLAQRVRRLLRVGIVAAAALVVPGLAWGLGVGWVHALDVPGTVNTPLSLATVVGDWLDLLARGVGADVPDGRFLDHVRLLAQVAILVVATGVALTAPTGRSGAVRAVAVVMGATVMLSPVVHLWYFLWVLPFVGSLRLSRLGMTGLLAVSVVAGLVAPLDSSLHGAYLAIVIGSMLVAALTLLLLITPRARERLRRIATPAWTSSIDATVADHG